MVQDELLRQLPRLRLARRRDVIVVEHDHLEAPVTAKAGDGIGLDRRRLRSCLSLLPGPHEWDLDFAKGPGRPSSERSLPILAHPTFWM